MEEARALWMELLKKEHVVKEYRDRFQSFLCGKEDTNRNNDEVEEPNQNLLNNDTVESENTSLLNSKTEFGNRTSAARLREICFYDDLADWKNTIKDPSDSKLEEIKTFLNQWFEKKYFLAGGRIRLILQKQLIIHLREEIRQGLRGLSLQQLQKRGNFIAQTNVPSILYSVVVDRSIERPPLVLFASDPIQIWAWQEIVLNTRQVSINLLDLLKDNDVASTFFGNLFERIVMDEMSEGKEIQRKKKKLSKEKEKTKVEMTEKGEQGEQGVDSQLVLQINRWERVDFNSDLAAFVTKLALEKEDQVLLLPTSSNNPQVDGILVGKKVFFQVTIARKHSFIPHFIGQLCRKLGWEPGEIEFIFIVPSTRYSDFQYQTPLTVEGKAMSRVSNIQQYAIEWPVNNWFRAESMLKEVVL
jgi:hypothetical protein